MCLISFFSFVIMCTIYLQTQDFNFYIYICINLLPRLTLMWMLSNLIPLKKHIYSYMFLFFLNNILTFWRSVNIVKY